MLLLLAVFLIQGSAAHKASETPLTPEIHSTEISPSEIHLTETRRPSQNDRLMQDIRIGESILSELMSEKPHPPAPHGAIARLARGQYTVRGEYIDGYGVHFVIADGAAGREFLFMQSAAQRAGDDAETPPPDDARKRIETILRDYLVNYAVISRNLPDDEHVRLTYGRPALARAAAAAWSTASGLQAGGERQTARPHLSVWASVADLKSHKSGNLTDDGLQRRIRVADLSGLEIGNDLKIFSSVLKTALDNLDTAHLRAGREPAPHYIPGFGVHYNIQISARGFISLDGLQRFVEAIDAEILSDVRHIDIDLGEITRSDGRLYADRPPDINFRSDSIIIAMRKADDSLLAGEIDAKALIRHAEEIRERMEEARKRGVDILGRMEFQSPDRDTLDHSDDIRMIQGRIEETMMDYGRTLRSLSDDEFLMVTVNWRGRNLPGRTTLRISKTDLAAGKSPDVIEHRER